MRTEIIGPGVLIIVDDDRVSASGIEHPQRCSVIRTKTDMRTVMSEDRITLPIFTNDRSIELFMNNHSLTMDGFEVYTYQTWDNLIYAYTGRGIQNVHVNPTGLDWIPVVEIPFCKSAELVA